MSKDSTEIGVEKRLQQRKRHQLKVVKKAEQLIDKHFPSEASFPASQDFNTRWLQLLEDIEHAYNSNSDLKRAFNHCVGVFNKRAELLGIDLDVPSFIVTQKAEKTIYNQALMQEGAAFHQLYSNWFDKLSQHGHSTNISDAYRSIIISFICYSGCLNHHLVKAISAQLNAQLDISTVNNLPFISLEIDEHGYHTNIVKYGKKTTEFTWYLSPLTISCIEHFFTLKRTPTNANWQAPIDNKTIHALITNDYIGNVPLPNSLEKLVKSAITVIPFLPNMRISQSMLEYSMGRNIAYSLPKANLARLVTSPIKVHPSLNFYSALRNAAPTKIKLAKPTLPSSKFFSALSKELKESNNKKLTSDSLAKKLQKLVSESQLSTAQEVLIEWFIHKLDTCKPSTIRTYHSTLSRKWLYQTESINLNEGDEQDFQDLYTELIELTNDEKAKTQLAARLSDFHAFAVQQFGFPLLLEPIKKGSKYKNHTSAGFIDETLFKALLKTTDKITDLDFNNKLIIKSILIISYRCGLRISEITKLRLIDIENSQEGWLKIRENKFENNKTPSSRRKVPLYILLLEHEKKIITTSLNLTRQENINAAETRLAFTIGQDNSKPIDKFLISNFTTTTLRQLSGLDHLVFHHLRHSTISRVQLIFELGDDSVNYPEIVPYSLKQINKITDTIAGKNLRNKYYAIAAFDGHSSPATCFSNYFHFCDLVLYSNLLKMKLKVTQKQLLNLALGSRRNLSHLAKLNKTDASWSMATFLGYTVKKLKFKPIKTPNPKNTTAIQPESDPKPIINIDTCYRILKQMELGIDPIELAFKYHIESDLIDKWHTNATALMAIKTHYNTPRLQSKRSSQSLLPSQPSASSELKWLDSIITKVRQQYPHTPQAIQWALAYALNNKSNSKSGIYFSKPEDLERFIATFSFAIPKSKWRVQTLSINHSILKEHWRDAYKGIQALRSKPSSHKGRTGNGAVWLELRHSDEKEIIGRRKQKKYSSNALMFLFHMMGIMMMNNK